MAVEYNKLNGLFLGIEILVWIVGIGTLLAGVIGISNIMLIVVKERTKEIGVKRALGAVPSQIIGQIVFRSHLFNFYFWLFWFGNGHWIIGSVKCSYWRIW